MPFTDVSTYRQPTPEAANMPRPALGLRPSDSTWQTLLRRLRDSVKTGDSAEVLRAFLEYIPAADSATKKEISASLAASKKIAEGHAAADAKQVAQRVAVQEQTVAEPLRASLDRYDAPTKAYITDVLNNADSQRIQREQATQASVMKALTSAAESARGKSFTAMFQAAKDAVQGKGK